MRIVFFGSFQHYSALILESLISHPDIDVVGVVTTPSMPVGRKQIITKTPVHLLADHHHLPVFTPKDLNDDSHSCRSVFLATQRSEADISSANGIRVEPKIYDERIDSKPDYFITAGYGKILPQSWLDYPTKGSLNLHFSLLPAYRGANPAEWAIMCGETKTGITLITMSDKLDGGDIIAQSEINIEATDTRETLYEKLYRLGADQLPKWLVGAESRFFSAEPQPPTSPTPYAALLKRQDGFIPWSAIQNLSPKIEDFPSKHLQKACLYATRNIQPIKTEKIIEFMSRLPRALATYPSLWTIVKTVKGEKRMKIISFDPNIIVQIEGGQPTHFNQIKNQITG